MWTEAATRAGPSCRQIKGLPSRLKALPYAEGRQNASPSSTPATAVGPPLQVALTTRPSAKKETTTSSRAARATRTRPSSPRAEKRIGECGTNLAASPSSSGTPGGGAAEA